MPGQRKGFRSFERNPFCRCSVLSGTTQDHNHRCYRMHQTSDISQAFPSEVLPRRIPLHGRQRKSRTLSFVAAPTASRHFAGDVPSAQATATYRVAPMPTTPPPLSDDLRGWARAVGYVCTVDDTTATTLLVPEMPAPTRYHIRWRYLGSDSDVYCCSR